MIVVTKCTCVHQLREAPPYACNSTCRNIYPTSIAVRTKDRRAPVTQSCEQSRLHIALYVYTQDKVFYKTTTTSYALKHNPSPVIVRVSSTHIQKWHRRVGIMDADFIHLVVESTAIDILALSPSAPNVNAAFPGQHFPVWRRSHAHIH